MRPTKITFGEMRSNGGPTISVHQLRRSELGQEQTFTRTSPKVRPAPETGHWGRRLPCQLWAIRRHGTYSSVALHGFEAVSGSAILSLHGPLRWWARIQPTTDETIRTFGGRHEPPNRIAARSIPKRTRRY